MDQAALEPPASRGPSEGHAPSRSWRLRQEHAREAQGLVVSPFEHLEAAEALFLCADRVGGAWLQALRGVAPITAAVEKDPEASTAIAFTWSGLKSLGLDEDALQSFSRPFRQGMHQADRCRRLGDEAGVTVVEGGAQWSAVERRLRTLPGARARCHGRRRQCTRCYSFTRRMRRGCDQRVGDVEAALEPAGVAVVHRLRLSFRRDADRRAREHFGFADGFSQPIPHGEAIVPPAGTSDGPHPWHGVAAGEILMGHPNAHNEVAPGPIVAGDTDPGGVLPKGAAPEGFSDLGRNGSYLVVRELRQDVASVLDLAGRGGGRARAQPGRDRRVAGRSHHRP